MHRMAIISNPRTNKKDTFRLLLVTAEHRPYVSGVHGAETLMHNTPAESNEQAPTEEQPDPILENTVLSAELPTLIIQPNTTVNSFARSRHRAQQRWCALLKRICKSGVASRLASSQWDDF